MSGLRAGREAARNRISHKAPLVSIPLSNSFIGRLREGHQVQPHSVTDFSSFQCIGLLFA